MSKNGWARSIVCGVVACCLVVSSAGIAHASVETKMASASDVVSLVASKGSDVLRSDTVISDSHVIVAPLTDKNKGQDVEPTIAAIAALDSVNSVVGHTEASQSLMTVLREGTSTAQFTMSVPEGFRAELSDDGSIHLRHREASLMVPFIAAPWAIDSDQKKLPTSYALVGNTITQTVDTNGARFPVVADPSIQWIDFPPTPVLALSGIQLEAIAKSLGTLIALGPAAVCAGAAVAGLPGRLMAVVCSLVGMGSIMSTVNIIGKIWNARSDLRRTGCYGLYMFNPSRKLANLPFRDCL